MTKINVTQISQLKKRLTDPLALAYIAELEFENERLYSHHSECKVEYGTILDRANNWLIKSIVLKRLLSYLNKINPFWYEEDLEKEIEYQCLSIEKERQRING